MDFRLSTGPCWARHLCESLWQGENYILQIDSHMRFRCNWDSYLISAHNVCKYELGSQKPIITTYPIGYTLPNNVPNDIRATILVICRIKVKILF
jgi:[Skp1-protein]-hydroxyproline N-acetylglucosaminyltransferase